MSCPSSQFESWLSKRLMELGTDDTVFMPYILGILQGEDESSVEKEESLEELLSEILSQEETIKSTLSQILERWRTVEETNVLDEEIKKTSDDISKIDLVEQMNKITQEKLATYTPKRQDDQTEEQRKMKEAILQGYAETADGSDDDDEEGEGGGGGLESNGLMANTNVSSCQAEQTEMRERQKAAAVAKKEKDKLDRENQKKTQEERKKKAQAKAQKGERRA